jgi:hypothetical protein
MYACYILQNSVVSSLYVMKLISSILIDEFISFIFVSNLPEMQSAE